jgi:hypothetical protein
VQRLDQRGLELRDRLLGLAEQVAKQEIDCSGACCLLQR